MHYEKSVAHSPHPSLDAWSPVVRYFLIGCGWVFLGLGAIGLFFPVLPTTPFVLLAAACFLRSSERLHAWLVGHPVFGEHIRDYLAGRGLRMRTKIVAVTTLWASILASAILWVPFILVDIALIAIAIAVTRYLLRLPTAPPAEEA